jgi:hypothetical protein
VHNWLSALWFAAPQVRAIVVSDANSIEKYYGAGVAGPSGGLTEDELLNQGDLVTSFTNGTASVGGRQLVYHAPAPLSLAGDFTLTPLSNLDLAAQVAALALPGVDLVTGSAVAVADLGALVAQDGATAGTTAEGDAAGASGQQVFRVWGKDPTTPDLAEDQAGPWGRSWTTIDPATIADYRGEAGLPSENFGRFITEGILRDPTGVMSRPALALSGNPGGLSELVVPNPELQIEVTGVYGINPPI